MCVQSRPNWKSVLAVVLVVTPCAPALAGMLDALLPASVPGVDTQDGVTVQSRQHPEQQPNDIRAGTFRFWPHLDVGTGYDTNVLPGSVHRGSWEVITNPSLVIGSDWWTDALGAVLSLTDTRYLALPSQSRTDVTASVGWRLDLGHDQFSLGAAHQALHEDRGQVGTLASDQPVAFRTDQVSAAYAVNGGRWTIEPGLRITNWEYDSTSVLNIPTSQAYRDRVTVQGDVGLHYEWAPQRNLLFLVRAQGQDYTRPARSQPDPDSTDFQLLSGISYDADALWHWRILVGGETRGFASPLYSRRNNLVAEAALTWTPSGLTTIEASFSREGSDAAQAGISGLMLTSARLTLDYEYLRNVTLHASAVLQQADFFGGGRQSGTVAGLGMTWVFNPSVRVSATYDQTDLHGTDQPALGLTGGYSRGIGLLTLRLGL